MGFYTSHKEKKEEIDRKIHKLQEKLGEMGDFIFKQNDHELEDKLGELESLYHQLLMSNQMGVMEMRDSLKILGKSKSFMNALIEKASENEFKIVEIGEPDEFHDFVATVEYEYPITRTMTNPFTLDEIILVFDLDENDQMIVNKISLKNKHNLKEALDKGNVGRKNNDISKEE